MPIFPGPSGGGGGVQEFLTGDDVLMSAGIGAWVASSGTIAWDSGTPNLGTKGGSVKWTIGNTTTEYMEVPVSGTFEAGREYHACVALMVEEATGGDTRILFGVPTTDDTEEQYILSGEWGTLSQYVFFIVRWVPTANRTGVKLRIRRNQNTGGDKNYHVGYARVVDPMGTSGLAVIADARISMVDNPLIFPVGSLYGGQRLPFSATDPATAGGAIVAIDNARALLQGGASSSSAALQAMVDSYLWLQAGAEEAPADRSGMGVALFLGEDFLDLVFGEKDAGTIQVYSELGFDIELADNDAGRWKVTDDAQTAQKILYNMEERKGSSASATITSGNTSVTVTHGAGYTPSAQDVVVTPTNNPTNDPGNFWIDTITATQFNINVRSNPGASGAIFAWRVDR